MEISMLLADLKKPEQATRNHATRQLWRIWFEQKGASGLDQLRHSQVLLEGGEVAQAAAVLTALINAHPDFAEAWNRRAVLYYTQGQYQKSLEDCQVVLQLNPAHFGALHGLGLCHIAQEHYAAAIAAFREALDIQPYALVNQKLILECTAMLS